MHYKKKKKEKTFNPLSLFLRGLSETIIVIIEQVGNFLQALFIFLINTFDTGSSVRMIHNPFKIEYRHLPISKYRVVRKKMNLVQRLFSNCSADALTYGILVWCLMSIGFILWFLNK